MHFAKVGQSAAKAGLLAMSAAVMTSQRIRSSRFKSRDSAAITNGHAVGRRAHSLGVSLIFISIAVAIPGSISVATYR